MVEGVNRLAAVGTEGDVVKPWRISVVWLYRLGRVQSDGKPGACPFRHFGRQGGLPRKAQARENAKQLDVPPANIALFQKYEADIKKYAMSGLEWIGF